MRNLKIEVIVKGHPQSQVFTIDEDFISNVFKFGREGCDVNVNLPYISKLHFCLIFDQTTLRWNAFDGDTIKSSTHGTW